MPVVINEFEVVEEPRVQAATPAPAAEPSPPPLNVAELERRLAELRARRERVRAY